MISSFQDSLFATPEKRSVVVFDFETTGMSPQQGDRVIEVGAVRLEDGQIVDQFQSLINPGALLDPFISDLTGISNAMLAEAPSASSIIRDFYHFIGSDPMVAHNASFDKLFLDAEFSRLGYRIPTAVGCSMLIARRLFPHAPNHKLGTLVSFLDLPTTDRFHRALADASMTAFLWTRLESELRQRYNINPVPFDVLQRLGRISLSNVESFLLKEARKLGHVSC
ncbi:3'-5' exonuclease [Geopsychrobacter electrodiphilus]|uniref:3'-5' exonuclease n=1 Tax=Geopsychrobacter electrodiphilus TaxID=225196 RepID=UPI00035C37CB|nr:3'-5' exonuclease [Geopsychrobacter electrodiphilus]